MPTFRYRYDLTYCLVTAGSFDLSQRRIPTASPATNIVQYIRSRKRVICRSAITDNIGNCKLTGCEADEFLIGMAAPMRFRGDSGYRLRLETGGGRIVDIRHRVVDSSDRRRHCPVFNAIAIRRAQSNVNLRDLRSTTTLIGPSALFNENSSTPIRPSSGSSRSYSNGCYLQPAEKIRFERESP